MVVASEAQLQTLAPVVAYFDRKHLEREEKDVADKRFIASVLELMRAEGRDQTEWAERRRCRMGIGGDNSTSSLEVGMIQNRSPSPLHPEKQHRRRQQRQRQRQQRPPPPLGKYISRGSENGKEMAEETLEPTQAMIKIGRLKPTLVKSPDPPAVAAELAVLYLVLADQKGALKSFQLAVKPSPDRVPTKEERDEREMQERRLALLNKDRRGVELAKLAAQEVERERERAATEHARRRHAATGIYRCLLELKRPVQAAEAARARLDMCETRKERRQVEIEIHEALLQHDGLIEPAATNQGAWLKESAGALSDLHAAVLESLADFSTDKRPAGSSTHVNSLLSTEAEGKEEASLVETRSLGTDVACGGEDIRVQNRGGNAYLERKRERFREQGAPDSSTSRSAIIDIGRGVAYRDTGGAACGDIRSSTGVTRDRIASTVVDCHTCGTRDQPGRRCRRRRQLRNLGLILARKRQFAASRQAFEDAICDGPEECLLRERNKAFSSGFFLDVALEEASPSIGLDLDSRWQGGVQADENRRRALVDFTGFTGLHRGAETLVTALPPAGWANGGGASGIAYAERLSRSRPSVASLQRKQPENRGGLDVGGGIHREESPGKAGRVHATKEQKPDTAPVSASTAALGLMLRHVVPAQDVVCREEDCHPAVPRC